MKNPMKHLVLIITLTTLSLPAQAADDVAEEVLAMERAFSAYSAKHGFREAFAAFIADDMVKLDGGMYPTLGREDVLKTLPPFSDNLSITWIPHAGGISASKDMGYTWGIYTVHVTGPDGERNKSYGKYMTVWEKNAEGKWQVVLDAGNSAPGNWPNVQ